MTIFERFVNWIRSIFKPEKPEPTPEPIPEPTPEPPPEEEEEETTPNPEALYGHRFDLTGAKQIKTNGGFVNNPANSRKKLKTVWPNKYSGKIAWVVAFTASGWTDVCKRAYPNEGNNRQRYYGTVNIKDVPQHLYVRAHIVENGKADDVYVYLDNPQQRYD